VSAAGANAGADFVKFFDDTALINGAFGVPFTGPGVA